MNTIVSMVVYSLIIIDHYEEEYEKDMRNNKYMKEEGLWSNQSKNENELRRINYIKEKKELQKEEQRIKESKQTDSMDVDDDEEDNKNSRKRVLKSSKNNNVVIIESEDSGKKTKNKKNNKK